MNSVCIFLGSGSGNHPAYMTAAREMDNELAVRDLTCIYGGSRTGLMDQLADSALAAGGKVIGVTVQALKDRENSQSPAEMLDLLQQKAVEKRAIV